MILTAQTHSQYKIKDCNGTQLGLVQQYDTSTQEVTLAIARGVGDECKLLCYLDPWSGKALVKQITFVLEGSYAEDPQGNKV